MRKYTFFFLLWSAFIFAQVELLDNISRLEDFEVSYYIDDSHQMNFETVKEQNFIKDKNKNSLRSGATHIWLKLEIKNNTAIRQKRFLHNSIGYINHKLSFYELKKNKLIKQVHIDLVKETGLKYMFGSDSVYPFEIEAYSEKIFYLYIQSFAYQYYKLLVLDEAESIFELVSKHMLTLLIVGIFIALIFYNLLLYFNTRYQDYLYYSLYLLFITLWLSYEYALLAHYFMLYGLFAYSFNFILIISQIFLIIFMKSILQTSVHFLKENRWFNLMIGIFILNLLYGLIAPFHAIEIFSDTMTFSLIIYLGIGWSIYKKGNIYILYIIFAQIGFILFGIVSLFFYEGLIAYNYFTKHAIGLGIMLEAFLFTYLLSFRIRMLTKSQAKREEQNLYHQHRLSALSELLENISHQWRQPLAQITSSIMMIEVKLSVFPKEIEKIEKELDDIENIAVYLSQTIDDFKKIYYQTSISKGFILLDVIQKSLAIVNVSYEDAEINVVINIPKNIHFLGFPNELQQALLVILYNAKESFDGSSKKDKSVHLIFRREKKKDVLSVCDNGKGIDPDVLERVFDIHFTTKKEKKNRGIGLSLSKHILDDLMGIELSCENRKEGGVCFRMTFPKEMRKEV